jgi:Protein of unknown function (DUF3047)
MYRGKSMNVLLPREGRPATERTSWQTDRRRLCLGAAALLGIAGCGTVRDRVRTFDCVGLSSFSGTGKLGGWPDCWQEQVMRRDLPSTRYELVERDQYRVLHAVANRATSGLRCNVDIDPIAMPWFSWGWRVDSLETNATVAVDELDDCPVRVILAFEGDDSLLTPRERLFQELVGTLTGHRLPFATLMYVWDGQAGVESVLDYARSGRVRYLVVESGSARTGRWLSYRRHVADDYRRVFGVEPGRLRSVGVLTDSDDLRTNTEAWYTDMAFSTGAAAVMST